MGGKSGDSVIRHPIYLQHRVTYLNKFYESMFTVMAMVLIQTTVYTDKTRWVASLVILL